MAAVFRDEGGAPSGVFRQVSLVPGALIVGHPVEVEGKDAGLARGSTARGYAYCF